MDSGKYAHMRAKDPCVSRIPVHDMKYAATALYLLGDLGAAVAPFSGDLPGHILAALPADACMFHAVVVSHFRQKAMDAIMRDAVHDPDVRRMLGEDPVPPDRRCRIIPFPAGKASKGGNSPWAAGTKPT